MEKVDNSIKSWKMVEGMRDSIANETDTQKETGRKGNALEHGREGEEEMGGDRTLSERPRRA